MRAAADPTQRLKRLEAAREKIGRKKVICNAEEMASIVGVTWRHLKPQIEADKDWPVLRRGAEGISYEFNAAKVLDHMIRKDRDILKQLQNNANRLAELTDLPMAATPGLAVQDLLKIDQLQTSVQRRKIEQRDWVKRAEHELVVGKLLTIMQSETLATVSRLDPAGLWPADVRSSVAEAMRSLLVRIHDEADREFADQDAGPESKPRSRARATR